MDATASVIHAPNSHATDSARYGHIFYFSTRWSTFALPLRRYFDLIRAVVAWIGRGVTIAWPPRSPDLTSVEFSVWDTLKATCLFPLFQQV